MLAAAALLAPLVACFAPRGLAPLLAAIGVALALQQAVGREWRVPPARVVLPAAALAVWAMISALWAVDAGAALSRGARLAFEVGAGALLIATAAGLDRPARRRVGAALAAGVVAAAAVLVVESLSEGAIWSLLSATLGVDPYGPVRYNRSATVLALFAWPAALALWLRGGGWRLAGGVLAVLAVVAVMGHHSTTSKAAVVLAVVAGGAGLVLSRRVIAGIAAVAVAAGILAAPLVVPLLPSHLAVQERVALGYSFYHRVYIWHFVAERIAERPLAGWGMEAARVIPEGGGQALIVPGDPDRGIEERMGERLPLHPHNATLEVWLDLGLVGAVLLVAMLWATVAALRRTPPGMPAACGWATFAAALAIAHSSYGIWQSWWVACLWLTAAWVVATAGSDTRNAGAG